MANNKESIAVSKGVLLGIIAVLVLILLFMLVPGFKEMFTMKYKGFSSGTMPVNVKVNGEPVRSTTSESSRGTDSDSAVNVDVKETKDGTTINIQVPEEINANAEGTSASVGPLPSL